VKSEDWGPVTVFYFAGCARNKIPCHPVSKTSLFALSGIFEIINYFTFLTGTFYVSIHLDLQNPAGFGFLCGWAERSLRSQHPD
jgi:uncharacterized membrane protein (GlpM family)